MLSNTQLTIVRNVATAIVAALATVQVLYPSYTWITAVTVAFATLGIHANVSAQQTKGNTVSDNGLTAMGLQPAEQVQAQPVQEAAPATEAAPAAETGPLPSPVATPEEVSTAARQALTDAANALLKIAETL